ncbi:MAG: GNAT family N-acetyltransferase [Microthrixaceae bacterium]
MTGRPYDPQRDLAAVTRIWREVGWIDDSERQAAALADVLNVGHTVVAEVGGAAECAVHTSPGSLRYGPGQRSTDLDLSLISAVVTSHVARRQGLASALVTESLASAAASGAAVATLGIFDQGFYDRFGFGTGAYEHVVSLDPATLKVPVPNRAPVRVGFYDQREVYDLLVRRHRCHGSVTLGLPELTAGDLSRMKQPLGLGFRSDDGRLTHCLLGTMTGHHGPVTIDWLIYEQPPQVLELLGLVRALGDQVRSVTINPEPPGVQLQDLINEPMRQLELANVGSSSRALHTAWSKVQWRMLDLGACIEACAPAPSPLTFGLRLHDPLADRPGATWSGIGGEFTVHLGADPGVHPGLPASGPVLEASVGAFTRLWLGVRPASGLALTDRLAGPPTLIEALDLAFCLPPPLPDWHF